MGGLKDADVYFSIGKKEIFYYDQAASYEYSLLNNALKIKYTDYNYEALLKMTGNDTLIMTGMDKFKGDIDTLHKCN